VPPAKLLLKGETVAVAVERYRGKLSDLASKLDQVRAAPWPSALAIQTATEQIKAMATPPECTGIINHLQPIGFATQTVKSMVHTEQRALAFSEVINCAGLVAWIFERELIAKVTAEIKQAARDGEALDEKQRAAQETALLEQMAECEYAECGLIWDAESRGDLLDFRHNTTPAALLGVRSVVGTRPAVPPSATYSIAGPQR
jgi:hypothetical protein